MHFKLSGFLTAYAPNRNAAFSRLAPSTDV